MRPPVQDLRVHFTAPTPTGKVIEETIDRVLAVDIKAAFALTGLMVFLAGDEASNIHGTILSVDGGFSAV